MNTPNNLKLDDIFQHHYEDLKAYVTTQVDVKEDAGDIVHDTYLRLHRMSDWGKVKNAKAFIYRTARNLIIDRLRRMSKQVSKEADSQCEILTMKFQEERSPLTAVLSSEKHQVLKRAIATLPEKSQTIFILHKFSGLKYAEIASRMNISKSSVEKHIIKALRQCRQAMKDYQ